MSSIVSGIVTLLAVAELTQNPVSLFVLFGFAFSPQLLPLTLPLTLPLSFPLSVRARRHGNLNTDVTPPLLTKALQAQILHL